MLPKVFEPFGSVGEPEARELVEWLHVPSTHARVRRALERMLEKQSSLWRWPESVGHDEIVGKEIVPRGVTLFPRVRWTSHSKQPELAVSGLNLKGVAFTAMLKLSQAGLLARVRRCESCRKWLFADSTRQRFHTDGCREKGHRADRKTPEGRAKRAEYMREYRKNLSQIAGVRIRRGQRHGLPTSKKAGRKEGVLL
jgi:hypothetical protein